MDGATLKSNLTIDDVYDFLVALGGDPEITRDRTTIISRTICHNPPHEGSRKLWYKDETKMFHCFTECSESFDIFSLVCKVKRLEGDLIPKKTKEGKTIYVPWKEPNCLPYAIKEVGNFFGIEISGKEEEKGFSCQNDLTDILKRYKDTEDRRLKKSYTFSDIGDPIKHYPFVRCLPWEREGISFDTLVFFGIKYDPVNHGMLIPHKDIENRTVGIRIRTLVKALEEFGKYRPAIIWGKEWSHPLSYNLFGIDKAWMNIKKYKKAVVFEGEKSPMLFVEYFGKENNISVACCGSSLKMAQFEILLSLGVEEIVLAFDRQYKIPPKDKKEREWWKTHTKEGKDFVKWMKNLKSMKEKFSFFVKITFILDKTGDYIGYKDAPIDNGKENYLELYKRREEEILWE